MSRGVIGRDPELRTLVALLERARHTPAAVILDGAAGIGKTTLCRAIAHAASDSGFTVLTATGATAEVSLAWAALADLLDGIDADVPAALSSLHQQALQVVMAGLEGPGGDDRLMASAFKAALSQQTQRGPVLIVVDDAQWLDEASKFVLGFVARRLEGPVALIVALRSGADAVTDRSWLQTPDPKALTRLTLRPLSPYDIDVVVADRLGHTPPPPAMKRIRDLSGGNPFYALELARAVDEDPAADIRALPPTLAGLMRERIGELDPAAVDVVVTAAAAFAPTVEVIARATARSTADVLGILESMESRGLLTFDGPRIRFTHPLIASAVAASAGPADMRHAHHRLAATVDHPESRARHLALSSPHGDPDTLTALDAAAEDAAAKGAYSTAAELYRLAVHKGGESHWRRLRGADFAFRSGALDDAEALAAPIIEDLPAGFLRTVGLLLMAAIRGYRDGLVSATELLQRAVDEAGDDVVLRTQALLALTLAVGASGDKETCIELARRARADAEASGTAELRSQALSLWTYVSFQYGMGLDSEAIRAALELEDPQTMPPTTALQPSAVSAMIDAWMGRLDEARAAMTAVSLRCEERGTEIDVLWAAEQLAWIDVAQGCYADAERIAAQALRRAGQIGGHMAQIIAHTVVANTAATQGRLDEARAAAALAVDGATAAGLNYWSAPPLMSQAFAEVSDGRYDEALQTLKPLLDLFEPDHDTEIRSGAWLPDAVEALTAVGRAGEAEPLVVALESNGVRLDRPWMLAVGARSRALVRAAENDLDGALESAERALDYHERLPMPFERARTQLLVGQLQRRRRRTHAAQVNLNEAAAVFEEIGSPLWAARARSELARLTTPSSGAVLTDTERQMAELAAAGLTNKAIAAKLYISTKTVEMHLSNAYRKLGIRSRAQLANGLRNIQQDNR